MKIIGITGQTGAGKSTVCQLLEKRGYYHLDADEVAHEVVENDADVLAALCDAFGNDIIKNDGSLSRPKLAARAFRNKQTAEKLDGICYPAVIKKIKRIIKQKAKQNFNGVLIDAIGLYESGADKLCDFTVFVTADREKRLERIITRDGITRAAAEKRIDAQKDDAYYKQKADYTVKNNSLKTLEKKISEILDNEQAKKEKK
jgi:dephospho-CoA kinase